MCVFGTSPFYLLTTFILAITSMAYPIYEFTSDFCRFLCSSYFKYIVVLVHFDQYMFTVFGILDEKTKSLFELITVWFIWCVLCRDLTFMLLLYRDFVTFMECTISIHPLLLPYHDSLWYNGWHPMQNYSCGWWFDEIEPLQRRTLKTFKMHKFRNTNDPQGKGNDRTIPLLSKGIQQNEYIPLQILVCLSKISWSSWENFVNWSILENKVLNQRELLFANESDRDALQYSQWPEPSYLL